VGNGFFKLVHKHVETGYSDKIRISKEKKEEDWFCPEIDRLWKRNVSLFWGKRTSPLLPLCVCYPVK